MSQPTLGQLVYSFFIDHLQTAKGLRHSSITGYRDGLRLFLRFVAEDTDCSITKLPISALTSSRVLGFLQSLEERRSNHIRTRNHRLAILRTFFGYLGDRVPELLAVAEQVTRIPTKRVPPPETHFLEGGDTRPCSPACHPAHGARCAIALCYSFCTTRVLVPRRWRTFDSGISISIVSPASVSMGKATSGAPARYGRKQPMSCGALSSSRWFSPRHQFSDPSMAMH